jgi:hypothetical protein
MRCRRYVVNWQQTSNVNWNTMTNFTITHGDTWTSIRKEKEKTTVFVEITQMRIKIKYNENKILTSNKLLEFQGHK